jgi:hypothetical protein
VTVVEEVVRYDDERWPARPDFVSNSYKDNSRLEKTQDLNQSRNVKYKRYHLQFQDNLHHPVLLHHLPKNNNNKKKKKSAEQRQ